MSLSLSRQFGFQSLPSESKDKTLKLKRCDVMARSKSPPVTRAKEVECDRRRFSLPPQPNLAVFSEIPPSELAAQMTLLDFPLFLAIPAKELLECQWNSKQKQEAAPNIVAFIAHFNQICYWLVREILSVPQLKARGERLAFIIRLGNKLLDLGNLNGVKAVTSALSSQPVFRLEKTWAELSKKDRTTYARLSNLMSDDDNKSILRRYMENMPGACIPFLGMFLTDLLFTDTVCRSKPQVNACVKSRKEEVVARVVAMQACDYCHLKESLLVVKYIQASQYLDELQMFEEDEHYRMSLALEPTERVAGTEELSYQCSLTSPRTHYRSNSVDMLLSSSRAPKPPIESSSSVPLRSSPPLSDERRLPLPLSVIAPEASSGPRHLIDGSLIAYPMSSSQSNMASIHGNMGSISSSDSGYQDVTMLGPDALQVVGGGVSAQVESSDDDNEILIPSQDCCTENGDSCRSCECSIEVEHTESSTTTISSLVQYRKTLSQAAEWSPAVRSSSLRSLGTSLARWKSAVARVCGNRLVLLPPLSRKSTRRKLDRNVSDLNILLVVDLSKPDVTVTMGKNRLFEVQWDEDKCLLIKTSTCEEKAEWSSVLTEILAARRLTKERSPTLPLMTFDDDDADSCVSAEAGVPP